MSTFPLEFSIETPTGNGLSVLVLVGSVVTTNCEAVEPGATAQLIVAGLWLVSLKANVGNARVPIVGVAVSVRLFFSAVYPTPL
ncbi:MAG: hypothetical protein M0Z95_26775 [Actinomycetota bacterium]|nr:hypothetical protein [Actinomycetota bacterium]